jgi:hypothetical protein
VKAVVALVFAAVVVLGCAGCENDTASPSTPSQPNSELSGIQSTLDNIDADMSGDANP